METPTRRNKQIRSKKSKANLGSPAEPQQQSSAENDGVWLPASKLQELLSVLPTSSYCLKKESSDTSSSDGFETQNVSITTRSPVCLPPIGVFWDIENCRVPSGVSALSVVQMIRSTFFIGYREAEFVVVCDVTKENAQVVQELNNAQIDLVHVTCISKNAADEKLRQSLRRFAERHGNPSAVILISSDINFASDLSDLRHRKKIYVILLHHQCASEALIMCSDQHHDYMELTKNLPQRTTIKGITLTPQQTDIVVSNLPDFKNSDVWPAKIKNRLKLLSANCGGRVVHLTSSQAVLRFNSAESAYRACVRMEGEDVFGSKISVDIRGSQPLQSISNSESNGRIVSPQPVVPAAYQFNRMPPVPSWSGGMFQPPPPPQQWPLPNISSIGQFQQRQSSSFRVVQNTGPAEQNYDTSLSSVSSWFRPSLLPPPQVSPLMVPTQVKPLPQSMDRRVRTPSPQFFGVSPFPSRPDADGSESFQPIQQAPLDRSSVSSPVDLQVSNLDHGLDVKDMRRRLNSAFREHVNVLQISVYTQSDGQISARVRVPSRQDAQIAVAMLQRQLIGNRRIRISVPNQNNRSGSASPCPQLVRVQVAAILKEVPSQRLPLFQLCDLYEKRFLTTVSLSELNRMRDVVSITEEAGGGRIISLLPESRRSVTPSFSDMAFVALQEGQVPELPYCPRHALTDTSNSGWAEKTLRPVPTVLISLPALSKALYALLNSHNGALPLYSLASCYEAEVCKLHESDEGVPLEHLLTWVKGVMLKSSPNGGCAKVLTWGTSPHLVSRPTSSSTTASDDSSCCGDTNNDRSTSPAQLMAQMNLFGREVVELLRASPQCQLPFTRFIPAYHHHFGRQCRVSNYGYTRLIELLEALPNVVQVIGEGDNRLVVLAQPAQIRRFTSDLLRVLKVQPNKQALLSELPELFTKCLDTRFNPANYGLCEVADLVSRVPRNTVVLNPPLTEDISPQYCTVLSLPKREQTYEELEKTKTFATELVSLLRDASQCTIPFNKFIPSYHHHFGHQCRLADFGVTKLTELLAAVSDVAQVEKGPDGERRIVLSLAERQRVLGEQVQTLVVDSKETSLLLSQLSTLYQKQYGVSLDPPTYGAATTFELVQRLSPWVHVVPSDRGPVLQPAKNKHDLGLKLFALLAKALMYSMPTNELINEFKVKYRQTINMCDLKLLQSIINISDDKVELNRLYMTAANIRAVLLEQGGTCLLGSLSSLYVVFWGFPLHPGDFGYSSIPALLTELSDVFSVSGKGKKRTVSLVEQHQQPQERNKAVVPRDTFEGRNKLARPLFNSSSTSGSNDQGLTNWDHLLPTPPMQQQQQTNPNPIATIALDKPLSSPWSVQPLGLHAQNTEKDMWSPIKLWSPPKYIVAPDPSELPLPSADLLERREEETSVLDTIAPDQSSHNLSDSGIGQVSPTSPQPSRRRHRLAAHFSSPIELL